MNIDEWFANQSNVEFYLHDVGLAWRVKDRFDNWYFSEWTLNNPVCMQVVREKLKIETHYMESDELWWCYYYFEGNHELSFDSEGSTIPEAEYACCKAIYEASK